MLKAKSTKTIFYLAGWVFILLFSLTARPTGAATLTDQQRCDAFKAQFNLTNNVNIVDAQALPIYCSASGLIVKVINYGLAFAGTVTVLFLMVGGFWYLTSAGNEEQAEKGKKTIINSLIGLVVIILSFAIVRIVAATLTSLGK